MSETAPIRFFLGSNSPQGFVSRFDQLDYGDPQWHTFYIKGGPGCGKSSFMKRLAAVFENRCPLMEQIPCSSDPDSGCGHLSGMESLDCRCYCSSCTGTKVSRTFRKHPVLWRFS